MTVNQELYNNEKGLTDRKFQKTSIIFGSSSVNPDEDKKRFKFKACKNISDNFNPSH